MNKKLIIKVLGAILLIEAIAMIPSLLIGLIFQDANDVSAIAISIGFLVVFGLPSWLLVKPQEKNLRAKDGFLIVSLGWLAMSVFGALPMFFSGMIPNYIDALFEAVSGFTTTGATVLRQFEGLPHGVMFWRSFTHWIGGMGVLVLTLALLPRLTGHTAHLVRAESPGPTMSKIVPKMGDSAKILYIIYGVLTTLEFLALLLCGMTPYEAAYHAISNAGTGGFSTRAASIGGFNSLAIEIVITVFMVFFSINFALYYRVIIGDFKSFFKNEELRWFACLWVGSVLLLSGIIRPYYDGSFFKALRYGSFSVSTILSTTGFGTADFNTWPIAAKCLIFFLMFIGACAGSTAGGMKVIRIALLCKLGKREISHTVQPRKVQVVRFEGKGIEETQLSSIGIFFFIYIMLVIAGMMLVSLEGKFDVQTNLSAALTCVSNVGPGFGAIASDFAGYGPFAKIVFSILMLAGRLEIFPILILFYPNVWRKG